MNKHSLKADKRTTTGRKVKILRREGLLPASLYGKGIASLSLQVNLKDFQKLEKEVGETGLVYLKVGEEERPVLISNLQFHPVSGMPIHTDFHQVNLKEAISANVPIILVGDAPAVSEGKGVLIQPMSEVEVEALPTDLPEKIEIDVTTLAEVDAALFVKDLKLDAKVKLLSDPEAIVAKIAPLAKEEIVEAPAPVEGAAPVPAEGESPSPEAASSDKLPEPEVKTE